MSTPADPFDAAVERLYTLLEQGQATAALPLAQALHRDHPERFEAQRLYGLALLHNERAADAIAVLQPLVRRHPDRVPGWLTLADAQSDAGAHADAIASVQQALRRVPDQPDVLARLGAAQLADGDAAAARASLARALQAQSGNVGARLNLAAALLALGERAAAARHADHAAMQAPALPDAAFLQGLIAADGGEHARAETAFARAQRLQPADARYPYQRGLALLELGRLDAADAAFEDALRAEPDFAAALGQHCFLRRRLCRWDGLAVRSARLLDAVERDAAGVDPFALLAEDAGPGLQRRCAGRRAAEVDADAAAARIRHAWQRSRAAPDAPIRVGLLSNGFGEHPTALLTVALWEALREPAGGDGAGPALALHFFATSADDGGPLRRRLRACANGWHDLTGLSADAGARGVREAGIELLIDLRGWGGGGVPALLALRPAPVQIHWLAYPGTSGAPWIDYVIADAFVLPPALRPHFSEAVAQLPRCFQPSDIRRAVGLPPHRDACGLPETGVVYASFNNSYKINPASFARFMAILRGVPDGVLWLLSGPGDADARLRAAAEAAGVDAGRLVFLRKQPHAEYLARYRHVDLFLDTLPYNAHTTASDALWAGCPVLTQPGDTFAGRVAGSLNHHLGLDVLNAVDDAAFVKQAIALGHDRAALAGLRATLAQRCVDSGVFDMRGFAHDFAALLRRIAARHRTGLAPIDLC